MSQAFRRFLASSILRLFTRIVLPCRVGIDDVLCATCSSRMYKGKGQGRPQADSEKQLIPPAATASECDRISRHRQSRRQLENLSSSPKQFFTQAPTVSVPTAAAGTNQSSSVVATGSGPASSISSTDSAFSGVSSTSVPSTSSSRSSVASNITTRVSTATIGQINITPPLSYTSISPVAYLTSVQTSLIPPIIHPSSSTPPSSSSSSSEAQVPNPFTSSGASSTFSPIGASPTSLMNGAGGPTSSLPTSTWTTVTTSLSQPPRSTLTSITPVFTTLSPTLPLTVSQEASGTDDPTLKSSIPLTSGISSLSSSAIGFPWSSSPSSSHVWVATSSINFSTAPSAFTSALKFSSTTVFFTITVAGSPNTVVTTVIETGVLSTDIPKPDSRFARNTGAVVGVVLSAIFGLILVICLLFFGCKRYRSRRNNFGSIDNILALARETTHRLPLDGDDESFLDGPRRSYSALRVPLPSGQSRSGESGYHVEQRSIEDIRSAEGGGQWSAESANHVTAISMHTTFGGDQNMSGSSDREDAVVLDQQDAQNARDSQIWWGINNLLVLDDKHEKSLPNDDPVIAAGNRSVASLTMVGGSSSSSGHGATSVVEGTSRRTSRKRNSLPGPRPMPGPIQKDRRHSSTPPTSFPNHPDPTFDHERQSQSQEQSDKISVKSFFSRLRNGRRRSTQSMTTIRGGTSPPMRGLDEPPSFSTLPNTISPSLLNPPITITPSHALLTFPRDVTGSSYSHSSSPQDQSAPRSASLLWPPVILPPPSPVLTENSLLGEGLLHPRLSRYGNWQASTASLRDNEDYTRPVNAVVFNRTRSTATFETQDTKGSGNEGQTHV